MAILNENYQKIGETYLGNSSGNLYIRKNKILEFMQNLIHKI